MIRKLITPLWAVFKANIGIGIAVTAFYLGTQSSHLVEKVEHNLFRRHLIYTEDSFRGSIEVLDVENDQGQLEKKLKNLDTEELLYTIKTDLLPDNDFIYKGLVERIKSSSNEEIIQLYENAEHIGDLLKEKLYRNMPVQKESVNPLKLDIDVRTNVDGELEAILRYGKRSVILTKKDFESLANTDEGLFKTYDIDFKDDSLISCQFNSPLLEEDPSPIQQDEKGNSLAYYGLIGLLGAMTLLTYKKSKMQQQESMQIANEELPPYN